jgi:hypothetical protein
VKQLLALKIKFEEEKAENLKDQVNIAQCLFLRFFTIFFTRNLS